jgi:hypothetical protein
MSLSNQIRIGLLAIAVVLAAWQYQWHQRQSREFERLQAELQSKQQEIEEHREPLAQAEEKYNALSDAERRAGNETLLSLMRERAAVTKINSEADSDSGSDHGSLAKLNAAASQQDVDQKAARDKMRADMHVFFTLSHLSAEQIDRYIDMQMELDQRKANRTSALLQGQMQLADALRQRDEDAREGDSRRKAIIGDEADIFLQSIAEGMRNDEAKRLLGAIQENMGGNALSPEQSDRMRELIKTEIASSPVDETDLFRSPEDLERFIGGHYQNVLNAAAEFLTPAQLETVKGLAAMDQAMKKDAMLRQRKSLGIK